MVSGNAKPVRGCKHGNIRFSIRVFIDRSCQRRFKKAAIAKPISPAKKRELLGMEIEDEINVELLRLVHFARAL